jgi:hypothetical protein
MFQNSDCDFLNTACTKLVRPNSRMTQADIQSIESHPNVLLSRLRPCQTLKLIPGSCIAWFMLEWIEWVQYSIG